MPVLLDLPLEILGQVLGYLELRDIFHTCSTCRSLRHTFQPGSLVAICGSFGKLDQLHKAIDDASYLFRCHALRIAFQRGLETEVKELTQRGASLYGTQCGKILKEKICECDIEQVDLMLKHGASLDQLPDGVNGLLEEIIRYEEEHDGLLEEVEYLFDNGASLHDVPSGYECLIDDLAAADHWDRLGSVLSYAVRLKYVPPFLKTRMREMYASGDEPQWLHFLLFYIPEGVDIIIDPLIQENVDVGFFYRVAAEVDALSDSDERRGRWSKGIRDVIDSGADLTALDEDGHTLLVNVAGTGFPGYVKLLLSLGVPIDQTTRNDMTPLYGAAMRNHPEVVTTLLESGANTSIRNNLGSTPLHVAAYKNHATITKILIDHDSDLNARNNDGWTPLFHAAYVGCLETVQLLIDAGADLTIASTGAADGDAWTPLYAVTSTGNLEMLELLIKAGGDIHASTPKGYRPVHAAAVDGHLACLKLLHAHGADLHVTNCEGVGTVHLAAEMGHLDVLIWLKDHGVDILKQTKNGTTAMHNIAHTDNIEAAKWLLQCGLSPNVQDENGTRPLFPAAGDGKEQMVRFLVSCGANIHEANNDEVTPMLLATMRGHASIIRLLLELGVDAKWRSTAGIGLMLIAATYGHIQVVRLLLGRAEIDAADASGMTPLMLAAVDGRTDIVRLLLDNGAEIDRLATVLPLTALHAALSEGQPEVAALLIARGASLTLPGHGGRLPVHYAANIKEPATIRSLLERNLEVDSLSEDGSTPLHFATRAGHVEVVKLLLRYKAEPSIQNKMGFTPLYYAAWYGYPEVVELLPLDETTHDIFHRAPLQRAITCGHTEVVKALAGQADSTIDGYGRTVYEWAIHQNQHLLSPPDISNQSAPREDYIHQSVVQLARRLLDTKSRTATIGFDELGHCLLFLGRQSDAMLCFEQAVTEVKDDVMTHNASCSVCNEDIKGTRYICRECPDVDFCASCVKSTERDEKCTMCKTHQCLEIMEPPPVLGDDIPSDVQDWLRKLIEREGSALEEQLPSRTAGS